MEHMGHEIINEIMDIYEFHNSHGDEITRQIAQDSSYLVPSLKNINDKKASLTSLFFVNILMDFCAKIQGCFEL